MCALAIEISPHKKSETTNLEATGSNQRRFERFDFFSESGSGMFMCGGFRALCKTKNMPSKAFKYGEHSTKKCFYLFPTCLVICFCFLLTLGCKTTDHEMFVLEVYNIFGT